MKSREAIVCGVRCVTIHDNKQSASPQRSSRSSTEARDEDLPPLVKRKICGGGNPAPSWRRVEHRARVGQGRCAPLARWRSAILDGPCARCCGGSQVGTEGWSFLIEQRDILMLRLPLAPARG